MTPYILSIRQAATFLGLTESAVRMLVFRKQIPHHRWGRRIFFLREELEIFLRTLTGVSIEEAVYRSENGR